MERSTEQKFYFRKNGFIVENYKFDYLYFLRLARAVLQFAFDVGVFLMLIMLGWLVFGIGFWGSAIMSVGAFWLVNVSSILLFKGRTIGMLIFGLQVVAPDGGQASYQRYLVRALFSAVHVLPIVGQIFSLCSAIVFLLTRGVTPIDLVSKTTVISKWMARKMWKIYSEYEEVD